MDKLHLFTKVFQLVTSEIFLDDYFFNGQFHLVPCLQELFQEDSIFNKS